MSEKDPFHTPSNEDAPDIDGANTVPDIETGMPGTIEEFTSDKEESEQLKPVCGYFFINENAFPLTHLGAIEEHDGKQYIYYEGWRKGVEGKEKRPVLEKIKGYAPLSQIIKIGQKVRIESANGEIEDNWTVDSFYPESSKTRVKKPAALGLPTATQDVSNDRLWGWQHSEESRAEQTSKIPEPSNGEPEDERPSESDEGNGDKVPPGKPPESAVGEEDPGDKWSRYLRDIGFGKEIIAKVEIILRSSNHELIKQRLINIGMEESKVELATEQLSAGATRLIMQGLRELGLPEDKADKAHRILVSERGRIQLKHIVALGFEVDQTEQVHELLSSEPSKLLEQKLEELGCDKEQVDEILKLPSGSDIELKKQALRDLGINEEDISQIILLAGGEAAYESKIIPGEIRIKADSVGISEDILNHARKRFPDVSWEKILDYLKIALKNNNLRASLERHHDIKLESPETEEVNLQHMGLTDIWKQEEQGKIEAGTWKTEKDRRENAARIEAKQLINKYRDFIPLDEIPLPPGNFTINPDLAIVDTPIYAYGLWRDIMIDSYEERIIDEPGKVREELHRLGGRVPLIRKVRQWKIAWSIMGKERSSSPGRDFGITGLGLKRWRELVQLVHFRDARVIDARRALSIIGNRSHFTSAGQDTSREALAREMMDIVEYEAAFERRMSSKIGPHRKEG